MLYTIKSDEITVTISDCGAEIQSILTKDGAEHLWQGNPDIWRGRSPVLFPIIGRLIDDKLKTNGKEYTMKKHGFARMMTFDVYSANESQIIFVLKSNDETLKQYPYEFELYIDYRAEGKSLSISYTVVNKNKGDMHFSIGGHPGFICDIGDVLEFSENETLKTEQINSEAYIDKTIDLLNNEKCIEITKTVFENDALFLSNVKSDYITLHRKAGSDVRVKLNHAPFLGLWAMPGAKYVCIEPWFGINDSADANVDFENKRGIVTLKQDETFEYNFVIEIM